MHIIKNSCMGPIVELYYLFIIHFAKNLSTKHLRQTDVFLHRLECHKKKLQKFRLVSIRTLEFQEYIFVTRIIL